MKLPFSVEQFYGVLRDYNTTPWPAQVFLAAPYPRSPFIAPALWCLIGVQAAFLLGVHQDLGLAVAGVVAIVLFARATVAGAPASALS